MKDSEFDIDLFLKMAEKYGATVSKSPDGQEGGIFVNGKPFTKEDFIASFENEESGE